MIAYTTVGTNDMEKARAFYDEIFGIAEIKPIMEMESFVGYGTSFDKPLFGLCKPFNGEPATSGNGTMVAIACNGPEEVKAMHAKALEMGATNEGDPGPRGEGGFYCGYFRDPDGNKLNAFCMAQPGS